MTIKMALLILGFIFGFLWGVWVIAIMHDKNHDRRR